MGNQEVNSSQSQPVLSPKSDIERGVLSAEMVRLVTLPAELSEIFGQALRKAFPGDLSALDILLCGGEIREATHRATMNALYRINQASSAEGVASGQLREAP